MWFWFGLEILRLVYKKAFFKIFNGFSSQFPKCPKIFSHKNAFCKIFQAPKNQFFCKICFPFAKLKTSAHFWNQPTSLLVKVHFVWRWPTHWYLLNLLLMICCVYVMWLDSQFNINFLRSASKLIFFLCNVFASLQKYFSYCRMSSLCFINNFLTVECVCLASTIIFLLSDVFASLKI